MNVNQLEPLPTEKLRFDFSQSKFLPEGAGCYVLAHFSGRILYVGLTNNLRRRIEEHLGNEEKSNKTDHGRAFFVYWRVTEDTGRVERTWMASHMAVEGELPILNKIFSPVST